MYIDKHEIVPSYQQREVNLSQQVAHSCSSDIILTPSQCLYHTETRYAGTSPVWGGWEGSASQTSREG